MDKREALRISKTYLKRLRSSNVKFSEGEETIIEPHAFAKDDFNNSLPIYKQIVEKGIRIA